jgi:hypothetical protein
MKYFFMLYTHALSPPSYLICAGERERERERALCERVLFKVVC